MKQVSLTNNIKLAGKKKLNLTKVIHIFLPGYDAYPKTKTWTVWGH